MSDEQDVARIHTYMRGREGGRDRFTLLYHLLFVQLWRLVTTFTFFGPIGFNFLFNIIFIYRYCRWLEEGSFRNKTSDFVCMFLFGGTLMAVSTECGLSGTGQRDLEHSHGWRS